VGTLRNFFCVGLVCDIIPPFGSSGICTIGKSQEIADRLNSWARVGPVFFPSVLNAGAGKKNFPVGNPGGIVQEIFLVPNSLRGKSQEFNSRGEIFSCGTDSCQAFPVLPNGA
jgi:hypothetical protein